MAKHHLRRVERCARAVDESRFQLWVAIIEARDSGESLRDIAEAASLSHQRIHQLIREHEQKEDK